MYARDTSSSIARLLFCAVLAIWAMAAWAQPDLARERRWAEEVVPGLVEGDAIYLTQKSGHRVLALYTPAGPAAPAVLIVHGRGVHPDWQLIGSLRSQLVAHGYATLSVQMPVLPNDAAGPAYEALFPDAAERLELAAGYLRSRKHAKIALVAHSLGARMANYHLARSGGVAAWVAIGLLGPYVAPEKLTMPVLDLYGERDFPEVLSLADARAGALRKVRGSSQIQVAGADHFFAGHERELVGYVRQFLDRRMK